MNRKQNRLLFILFFTLLMCMNLAKAGHMMVGKCRFQVPQKNVQNKLVIYFNNAICDRRSPSWNCEVTWELSNSGFTSSLTGNRHIQFRQYIDYSNLLNSRTGVASGYGVVPDIMEELSETKESDTLYRWNRGNDGTTNGFWAMSVGKGGVGGNLYLKDWMVFEVTKDKNEGLVQSPKKWKINIYDMQRNYPKFARGSVYEDLNADCVESIVPSFDSKEAVSEAKFRVGYDKKGVSYDVGDAAPPESLRVLEWGISDGKLLVSLGYIGKTTEYYYNPRYTGDLSSGNYTFMIEDKNPSNKDKTDKRPYYIEVKVSKTPGSAPDTGLDATISYLKQDVSGKPTTTGIKVQSVFQKSLKVVTIANRAADSEQKLEQKENEATGMKFLSNITFTLSRKASVFGKEERQTKKVSWGIDPHNQFKIKPDPAVDEWIYPEIFSGTLQNGGYSFTYIDKNSPGAGGDGVRYYIRITIANDAKAKSFNSNLNASVGYVKMKNGKPDNTNVTITKGASDGAKVTPIKGDVIVETTNDRKDDMPEDVDGNGLELDNLSIRKGSTQPPGGLD